MAELIIVFREVLEAALVVGILYTFVSKTGRKHLGQSIINGVFGAIAASVASVSYTHLTLPTKRIV